MRSFRGRIARVRALCYSRDGSLAASADKGALVRIWDVRDGTVLSKFRTGRRHASSLAFGDDGETLGVAAGPSGVVLWSIKDREVVGLLQESRSTASSFAFFPDGRLAITGGLGLGARPNYWLAGNWGCVTTWDVVSRKAVAHFTAPGDGLWPTVRPDGKVVAVGSSMSGILLWDPVLFPESSLINESFSPSPMELSREGASTVVSRFGIPQRQASTCVRFSPDGRLIASTAGWSIALYDTSTGEKVSTLKGHRQSVRTADFSPDGGTLASASFDGTVRFWDVETGEEKVAYDWKMGKVDVAVFSPDGMTVAAGGEGGIVIWDVE